MRRGDGTYVTSLVPRLLFEGFGLAVELPRDDTLLEVMEVRRLLEPVATGLAHITLAEHEAIHHALRARDQLLAQSTAMVHVDTSEAWLRAILSTT